MAWETFPYSYTSPYIYSWIFETLSVIIFSVRVTHKMLNVNWEKIHSIILSVTCHALRNFPLLIQIPSYQFVNFWNPVIFFFWVRVTHKMLNVTCKKIHSIILSVTCHGLRNFAPAHTHPLKTICEFLKPYELLFFELESLVKCNHKIRVQECYGGRAMSCPWHGGLEALGPPFGRHAALRLFHF